MPNEISAKEGELQVNGLSVRYFEAGAGDALIVVPAPDHEPSFDQLTSKLAESYRVICLDLSNHGAEATDRLAEKLSQAIVKLGINRYTVIGISSGAGHALALAIAAPEAIEKLILLSPIQPSAHSIATSSLGQVKAATLVLVGTRDPSRAAEAGRLCREKIHACHLSFIYGATHAIAQDRLDACVDTIREFLQQGEQFIISRESQMIRP
jgi:pimeloyl-ACP methyl ester carboxylesterase